MTVTDVDAREVLDSARKRLRGGIGELTDFAEDAREVVVARYHDIEDDLPVAMDQVVRRARIGGWQILRALISAGVAVPRLVIMLLRTLSRASDQAVVLGDEFAERAGELGVRGREALASLPVSRRERRRWRLRVVGIGGAGLVAGAVLGWLLARRQATVVTYEVPSIPDDGPWNAPDDPADTGEIPPVRTADSDADADDADADAATETGADEKGGGSLRSVPSDDPR